MATKGEKKSEFLRHKKEIEETYNRKLEALYELYPEFKNTTSSINGGSVSTSSYGSLKKVLHQAIDRREGEFTSRDLKKWISEIDASVGAAMTPASVSNALARLKKEQKIEQIKKGAGSSPSIFKKKN
ncbi:MAG: hypothetical protein A3I05_08110 [Deltaproteobacteria bacterium RIFCSPLOWO2_02_FULL_44_10]|nr:MAG: hypothetical protein A3C46_04990 [Deltaproteobacteria bacterium RIFCSPHIGHO2_02_FULL_44_16]OGQ45926.1 MAG: hypothetical protein A3I05_08110 [Deltaproteobacteria bacterium RIFCSPLOWO2_02_FULL_44_10]